MLVGDVGVEAEARVRAVAGVDLAGDRPPVMRVDDPRECRPVAGQKVQNSCACSVVQFDDAPVAERIALPGFAIPATPRK